LVDGVHHVLEDGIEELAGVLGARSARSSNRALEVGDEDGDLLALAFERAPGREDLLGEVLGGITMR
jgi:hypothetical protein